MAFRQNETYTQPYVEIAYVDETAAAQMMKGLSR